MRRLVVVLFVLLIAACGTPGTAAPPTAIPPTAPAASSGPCDADALRVYRNTYNDIIDRWGDVALKAGKAAPADLQVPIQDLQRISAEMAGLQPPACAQPAHAETLQAMRMAIDGYTTLLAQKDVGTAIRDSIDQLSDARLKVSALPATPAPTFTPLPTDTPQPTLTPVPTATLTPTPVPTATPEPRQGVISSKTTQLFESATSTQPVKTLFRDTQVLVFEASHGRLHIRAGSVDGWVSQSSVIIK